MMQRKPTSIIYCIGDSHVSFFSGEDRMIPAWPLPSHSLYPFFYCYRLGPVLAYNLVNLHTQTRGREKLFAILRRKVPPGRSVLLCFGEIDCRAHLLKQSLRQNRPIVDIVRECIERYFSVILEVAALGHPVLVWNVVPPTQDEHLYHPQFPIYGTYEERSQVTRLFNEQLCQRCVEHRIAFVSIYDHLLDKEGRPNSNYFMDRVHLSQQAMPLAIQALNQSGQNIEPETFGNRFRYYGNIEERTLWKIQLLGWRMALSAYRFLKRSRGKILHRTQGINHGS